MKRRLLLSMLSIIIISINIPNSTLKASRGGSFGFGLLGGIVGGLLMNYRQPPAYGYYGGLYAPAPAPMYSPYGTYPAYGPYFYNPYYYPDPCL